LSIELDDADMPGPGCLDLDLEVAAAGERHLAGHRSLVVFAALGRAGGQLDIVDIEDFDKELAAGRCLANLETLLRGEQVAFLAVRRTLFVKQLDNLCDRCRRRRKGDGGHAKGYGEDKCVNFTVNKVHDHSRLFCWLSAFRSRNADLVPNSTLRRCISYYQKLSC